jgi:hypothetical protein
MFNSPRCADAQEQPPSSSINFSAAEKYADETPEQQAKHRDIEWRHRRRKRRSSKFPNLRKHELDVFSPSDGVSADMRLMADHLAQLGTDRIALSDSAGHGSPGRNRDSATEPATSSTTLVCTCGGIHARLAV